MTQPVTRFLVTYERVGRRRDVSPLHVSGSSDVAGIRPVVLADVRTLLGSRDVRVVIDADTMTGQIICGAVHVGGRFTITDLTARSTT